MDVKTVAIRPATWDDLEDMVSLLQVLFAMEEDFVPDPDRQRQGLQRFLDGCGKHRAIFVARRDDRAIGMATIQVLISTGEGGPVGLVEDVVVRKEFRGCGIGRRLLAALTTWANDRNLLRLQLLADSHNRPALNFYRKNGWQATQLVCLRTKG